MLALRVLLFVCAAVIVFALLGYAMNRDPRWLRVAGYAFKGGVAIAALIGLLLVLGRFLAV
jgi:surface polysaccharide O-acyltransferase-like enzyme